MELDQNMIEKVLGLSDEELGDAVTRIALGLGLDQSLLKPYLSRLDQIRSTIAGMTPADLEKVTGALGTEKTQEILGQIGKTVDPS